MISISGKNYLRYEIIELDVWGNARDGFELNNLFHTNVFITLSEGFDDKEVIRALKGAGALKRNIHFKSIEIEDFGEGSMLCVNDARNGQPLVQLHIDGES